MPAHRTPRHGLIVLGLVTATLAASSLALVATPAWADTTPVASGAYGGGELAQAAASGVPVEVTSLTTETTQVMAEPNGQFALTTNRGPVRAMTTHGWAAIDTTLNSNADGSYSPKVTTAPVSFSGGGNTLLVSIGDQQTGIDTYWPGALPSPTVSANAITYPAVRAGVDLVMTATPEGYTETLVVKTPAAASALKASPIILNAVGHGVSVSQAADGSVIGTDSAGVIQFGGSAPVAWDSSVASADPTARPGITQVANAMVAPLGQVLSKVANSTRVTLAVPDVLLNSSATVYPVYVDPAIGSKARSSFRTVQSGGWNYGPPTSEPMRVGYCGWSDCTSVEGNARSFFNFDTTAITGQPTTAHIYSASVKAGQVWNAVSSASPVNLTESGAFSSGTTYPGPAGSVLQTISSACGWNNANACYLTFDNSTVVDWVQSAANNDWTNLNFSLSAPSENIASYWKKFSSTNTSTELTVYYNFPPSLPSGLGVSSVVQCPNMPAYTQDTTPYVFGHATSYNGAGSSIGLNFELKAHPLTGGAVYDSASPVIVASGAQANWYTPTLTSGTTYSLREYASTNSPDTSQLNSAWAGYYDFTVDNQPPAVPAVSSFKYPSAYWGTTPNKPGTFSLAGSPDTAGFTYSFDTGVPAAVGTCTYTSTDADGRGGKRAADANGDATITPPAGALTSGYHYLSVRSFDDAHNLSQPATYKFYVSPDRTGSTVSFIEGESLPVTTSGSTSGYTYVQTLASDSAGKESHLVAQAAQSSFTYTLNPATSGYYALGVQVPTGTHHATVTFQINGQDVREESTSADAQAVTMVNTCSTTAGTTFVPLGGARLNVGTDPDTGSPYINTLTVTMVSTSCPGYVYNTADPATAPSGYPPSGYNDNGYTAAIDDLIMAPIGDVTFSSLQAAFNNHGIGLDNVSPAAFDQMSSDNALSKTALNNQGIVQGSPYTIGGVTFDIPAAASNGYDNVIAAGQTITMPGNVVGDWSNPGYVNLLVASTCGDMIQAPSKTVGMTFANPAAPNGAVHPTWAIDSKVPNWTRPADGTVQSGYTVTMDHYVQGATASPVTTPTTVYLMKAPIPQNSYDLPLTAITLPTVGTAFTNTCDKNNQAIHVLAVATSAN